MKFRLASLFFLLSSTVFVSTPVLSMNAEVESTSSSSYVPAVHENPFADLRVDYDNLVRTFNVLRTAGNNASNTDLVAYLVKDENWKSLSHYYQKKLVGGVVEKASELRLDKLMHEVGIVPKYRAIRPINDASDEDLVAYLFGAEGWKAVTPNRQSWVVKEVKRRALELDTEEAMTQSGILEKYRLTRAAGDEASDKELVAYLFGEKWATLRSDIQKYIVRRVEETSSEMDRDTVFGLIRSGKLEESFEPLRAANGEDVSDEMIVKQALESLAFEGWNRLPEDEYSFVIDAVARKDPRAISVAFDEKSQIEVAKTYRSIKNSGNKASDGDIIKYVMEQMGYKSWDILDADIQAKITHDVVYNAKWMSIPEWLHSANLFFDEKQAAVLFTDKMEERDRQSIINVAAQRDMDEDVSPCIAIIAANMGPLFTPGMVGRTHRHIIENVLLNLDTDEIGPRMAAIAANMHRVFTPGMTGDDHGFIIVEALKLDTDEISPRMVAIAANAHSLFTPNMTGKDHEYIIEEALKLDTDEIGPRMAAIVRNAEKLFPGVGDSDVATLITELLFKTIDEIQALADDARHIYLDAEDVQIQWKAIRDFVLPTNLESN